MSPLISEGVAPRWRRRRWWNLPFRAVNSYVLARIRPGQTVRGLRLTERNLRKIKKTLLIGQSIEQINFGRRAGREARRCGAFVKFPTVRHDRSRTLDVCQEIVFTEKSTTSGNVPIT
jgi:hypothetical protein